MSAKDDEVYKLCPSCGKLIKWEAVICTYCGVQVKELKVDVSYPGHIEHTYQAKSKTTAVVLAIFFGYWSWLYTYRVNSGKFWFLLTIDILRFIFNVIFIIPAASLDLNNGQILSSNFYITIIISSIWTVITWLWALINNATKPNSFYTNYPKGL